jgi:hypothetical protein
MADYDSNLIKPVQGLQNIGGLSPAKRRKERKRRRQVPAESAEYEESTTEDETTQHQEVENAKEQDHEGIDYCA